MLAIEIYRWPISDSNGRLEHEVLRLALGESLSLARGSLSGGFRSVYAVALACGGRGRTLHPL